MPSMSEMFIKDARNFQKYGQYDLAIESLHNAQIETLTCKQKVEIQKLLSFNYRKLENYSMALYHINNALSLSSNAELLQEEYAICLMNKGVVYEELGKNHEALDCYLSAFKIFNELFDSNPSKYGMLLNAFLSIGLLYYKMEDYSNAKIYFEKSIPYFDDDRENDRRYLMIINLLAELKTD